jgi:transposase
LSVHRSKISKKFLDENGIKVIYNVPYSPSFNGIELFWNLVKQKYRKEMLIYLYKNMKVQTKKLVKTSLLSVKREHAKACALKGFCHLGLKDVFDH